VLGLVYSSALFADFQIDDTTNHQFPAWRQQRVLH
jgi:hypothetical protein